MADRIQSEGSKALNQAEHNPDAGAKRVIVRAQDPGSGDFVNVGATDNLDGTFSLKTDATFSGSVSAVTEYTDGASAPANPEGPTLTFDDAGTMRAVSDTNPLPVDATVNASVDLGDQNIGNATAATQRVVLASDQPVIPVSDNGSSLTVDATSLPLPTGAATAANQQTDALTDTELRATPVPVDLGANNDVTVTSSALPTGAATAANQSTLIGHVDGVETLLGTIDTDTGNIATNTSTIAGAVSGTEMQVDIVSGAQTDALTDTQLRATPVVVDLGANNDVSVSSSALPTGAATSANQSTIIGHIDGVETLLTTIEGNQLPDGHNVTIDNPGDIGGGVQYTEGDVDATPTGTVPMWRDSSDDSIVSVSDENPLPVSASIDTTGLATDTKQDAQTALLTTIESNQLPDGHNVTVDNASLAITAAALPLPTGAATAANQQTDALTDTELRATPVVVDLGANNDVTVTSSALPTGAATAANQLPDGHNVTVDNASIAVTGTFWQATQPVSGTVTANLSATDNAVLDTIEENTSLGATSAVTSVSGSASSVQLLAANTDRKEAIITNDSTALMYLKLGTTASTSSYTVKLGQDETFIDDKYNGRIDAIWASATGSARITEISE